MIDEQWGDQVTHVMVKLGGFHEILVCPGTFCNIYLDFMIAVHGDDFIGSGTAENLNIVDALMKEHFEVKVLFHFLLGAISLTTLVAVALGLWFDVLPSTSQPESSSYIFAFLWHHLS